MAKSDFGFNNGTVTRSVESILLPVVKLVCLALRFDDGALRNSDIVPPPGDTAFSSPKPYYTSTIHIAVE